MPRRIPWHPRIFASPYTQLVFDARMDAICEERSRRQQSAPDIVVDISALSSPIRLQPIMVAGEPWEWVRGERVPYRLRFRGAEWIRRSRPFADFASLPPDAEARRLFYLVHLRGAYTGPHYIFVTDVPEPADLVLRARGCELEPRAGAPEPVEYLRRWIAAPPPPARLVPRPVSLHARYGGDPIRIRLGGRVFAHRLFIGGLHHQRSERPAVDHVVNLCGFDSPWALLAGRHPADRFTPRLEMRAGMTSADLRDEARWVVEALQAGRRVLVHCAAGINRSSSVCCAALMLLEGLHPEEALARVRERHPEAHPDPYHWFALRHLPALVKSGRRERRDGADGARDLVGLGLPHALARRD
jgi:hypothetical protein